MLINVDLMWPVGSIYLNINNVNPSEYFGGKWSLWGSGRVPVCVDTSQTEFNSSEKTGGSKDFQNHTHGINGVIYNSTDNPFYFKRGDSSEGTLSIASSKVHIDNAGTGTSGNLQPYITCYMWKRVA